MPDSQVPKYQVTWEEIISMIEQLPAGIYYGVPKNGMIIALFAMGVTKGRVMFSQSPDACNYILDDIIDSGKTLERHNKYHVPFIALFDKQKDNEYSDKWLVMPWERDSEERPAADAVVRILEAIGEDPAREGLRDTPDRVAKTWAKIYGGYQMNPEKILARTFNERTDNIIVLRDIEIYSTCEHHMLPFYGRCHVGYLPSNKIVGISKLARLVECFARRLQIQERLTNQIAMAIMETLGAKGAGCIIEAQHFCMTARGIEKQNSVMVTSSMQGEFRSDEKMRNEFLNLTRGSR